MGETKPASRSKFPEGLKRLEMSVDVVNNTAQIVDFEVACNHAFSLF